MNFDYISTTIAGPSFDSSQLELTVEGCDCTEECTMNSGCSCISKTIDNYDKDGRLIEGRTSDDSPLMECNDDCSCIAVHCTNRRVQMGVKMKVEVRAVTGKGLGLFCLHDVKRGEFVCEYAGEMIGASEVERRRDEDGEGRRHNYVLTIKEHTAGGLLTWFVDPSRKGNIGRFINHSCTPNLEIVLLRIGTVAPIVGLFAVRDITAGEELSFDYGESGLEGEMGDGKRKECLCGSEHCRRVLPASVSASD